jgi:hypothetical protein
MEVVSELEIVPHDPDMCIKTVPPVAVAVLV